MMRLALLLAGSSLAQLADSDGPPCAAIVVDPAASALTQLAGRELRRYLWHSTAALAEVYAAADAVPDGYHRIVVRCRWIVGRDELWCILNPEWRGDKRLPVRWRPPIRHRVLREP